MQLQHLADFRDNGIFPHEFLFYDTGKIITFLRKGIKIFLHLSIGLHTVTDHKGHGIYLVRLKGIPVFFRNHFHNSLQ